MILNGYGKIVEDEIMKINKMCENIGINEFVVMSHVHSIIEIIDTIKGHIRCAPTRNKKNEKYDNFINFITI